MCTNSLKKMTRAVAGKTDREKEREREREREGEISRHFPREKHSEAKRILKLDSRRIGCSRPMRLSQVISTNG